jgi:hypothetical protein
MLYLQFPFLTFASLRAIFFVSYSVVIGAKV